MEENKKKETKKKYKKPTVTSQKILNAGLAATCNGTTAGGRKAQTPCSKLKT